MVQASGGAAALRYQRLAELAVTATARVELCRASDGQQVRLVAVKRLHNAVASDPQFLSMFRDEMWIAAQLKHANAVEVLDWGEDAQGPYLVMELVRGVSLARLMRTVSSTGEEFPERLVVYLGTRVCEGLAAAHALRATDGRLLNLVHRDLTPANVLVSFDGEVKIADFGLAKAEQRATQTITGVLKGNPDYMSPEQLRGESIDARSDLFAIGVMLFELFAQRRPWSAGNSGEGFGARLAQQPADLAQACPGVDRNLVGLVHRCLSSEPTERPASADEIAAELREWLEAHRYEDSKKSLTRFVRRNALRQMRWLERAIVDADRVERLPASEEVPTLINAFLEDGPPTRSRPAGEEATHPSEPSQPSQPSQIIPAAGADEAGTPTLDMATWSAAIGEPLTRRAPPSIPPGVVAAPDPDAPPPPPGRARADSTEEVTTHDLEGSTVRRPARRERELAAAVLQELSERYAREASELAVRAGEAADGARQAAQQADAAQEALRTTVAALAAAAAGDTTRATELLAIAAQLRRRYRND